MNDAEHAQNEGLTTEQIAAVGTGPFQDQPREQAPPGEQAAEPVRPAPGDADTAGARLSGEGGRFDGGGPADSLKEEDSSGPGGTGTSSADDEASLAAERESRARLLEGDELQEIVARWKEIQAGFVDEPRKSVEQADALVADLMQRVAAMFARERAELEQRWGGGNAVSTEELRRSLRRYRSFFERLLAA
jgi:hypothetical protein